MLCKCILCWSCVSLVMQNKPLKRKEKIAKAKNTNQKRLDIANVSLSPILQWQDVCFEYWWLQVRAWTTYYERPITVEVEKSRVLRSGLWDSIGLLLHGYIAMNSIRIDMSFKWVFRRSNTREVIKRQNVKQEWNGRLVGLKVIEVIESFKNMFHNQQSNKLV